MTRSNTPRFSLRQIFFLAALFFITIPCWPQWEKKTPPPPPPKILPPGITLTDITAKLHLTLPAIEHPQNAQTLLKQITPSEYSLEFARNVLIPAIGGSVAAADLDGSGYSDLYVVVPGGSNHFFHNLHNGAFADVTSKAGLAGTGSDLSATFGDYDHSGHASLFVAGLDGVRVYHNNGGGTFTDVTEKAGIKKTPGELVTSALLFDAEGNGGLDLLITTYTDLNAPPSKPSFLFPNNFASANSHLYHNQGDGTFREISADSGLNENPGRTHIALAADFTHSGHVDLLMLRDNKPPVLFRNTGNAKFEDATWKAGEDDWKYAYLDGQLADFDHDGKVDLALWSTIGNQVLMNQGDGKLEQAETFPIVFAANRAFGFHGITADLKGDGYDDMLMADNNGDWHYIANNHGQFGLAQVTLYSGASGKTQGAKSPFPELASLTPVRLQKSGKITLIGVRTDGRIIALEVRKAPIKATHTSPAR
jgi:FG-GAP-like repeat